MPGTKAVIDVRDPTEAGEQRVQPGDKANRAVRVNVVAGTAIDSVTAGKLVPLRKLFLTEGTDTGSTGDKLTYTCPAGKPAVVTGYSARIVVGAPTIHLELRRSTTAANVFAPGTSSRLSQGDRHVLEAGDAVAWSVSPVGVGSSADFTISVEEYTV